MLWAVVGLLVVIVTARLVAFGRTKADRAARDDPARPAYEGGCYSNTCGRGRAPGLMSHRMGRN